MSSGASFQLIRSLEIRASVITAVIGFGWLLAMSTAQSQQLGTTGLVERLPPTKAAEVRARLEESERQAGRVVLLPDDTRRRAVFEEQRAKVLDSGTSSLAQGVTKSVSASARCASGYVVSGRHRASAVDVAVVAEKQLDCDARGCRAYQVDVKRESEEPFDLDVSVVCTGA